MNRHFVTRPRRSSITTLAERPDGRHRAHAATSRPPRSASGSAAGSRHERADEHGLSHLIEHMAFKGTQRRSARADRRGHRERRRRPQRRDQRRAHQLLRARVLGEDVDLALDMLGDILTELDLRRGGAGAREGRHPAGDRAPSRTRPTISSSTCSWRRPSPDQPIGRPILGTPETVKSFDRGGDPSLHGARIRARPTWCSPPPAPWTTTRSSTRPSAHFGAMPAAARPARRAGRYTGGETAHAAQARAGAISSSACPGCSFKDPDYYAPTSSPMCSAAA